MLALSGFAALITGCSGGGMSQVPPTATPSKQTAAVTITLVIPAAKALAATSRSPRYVSPATSAVRTTVNGGTPQTFQVGTSQASCWPPQTNEVCSVFTIDAPVGNDTFVVTLLDASGNALSQATMSATIVSGQANTLHFVADGIVASLAIAVSGAAPSPGTVAHQRVDVTPLDADAYMIVGNVAPIQVTDSDPSAATALYLATDSTCSTPSSPPSSTVTLTQSNGAFPTLCLIYNGSAMASPATLTATVTGAPSATTHFQAATTHGSGVWALGIPAGAPSTTAPTLANLDANLNLVTSISGTATGLTANAAGLDVDAAGDVSVLQPTTGTAFTIETFAPGQSGNVAPHGVTTFTLPVGQVNMTGPALDRHGGAYVMGIGETGTAVVCTIYYVPLNGGASIATQVRDCTSDSGVAYALQGFTLRVAPSGDLYAGFDNTPPPGGFTGPHGTLWRYINGGSGVTPAGNASTVNDDGLAFFPNGNAIICRGGLGAAVPYTIATTASSVTATGQSPYDSSCGGVAVDASGNAYISSDETYFYPPGSTTHTKSTTAIRGILAAYVGP